MRRADYAGVLQQRGYVGGPRQECVAPVGGARRESVGEPDSVCPLRKECDACPCSPASLCIPSPYSAPVSGRRRHIFSRYTVPAAAPRTRGTQVLTLYYGAADVDEWILCSGLLVWSDGIIGWGIYLAERPSTRDGWTVTAWVHVGRTMQIHVRDHLPRYTFTEAFASLQEQGYDSVRITGLAVCQFVFNSDQAELVSRSR
mmetsp:Transcript_26620/g.74733  ORF Transcript_26620/g.74733 Transcript_26620/m.74733 type:complete len:201 (-) Transcript_26620:185-787(-)